MAFNRQSTTRFAPQQQQQDESWKAQGFINLYLPRKNGERAKLGAIPLRDSRDNEAALRAWLEADAGNIDKLLSKLVMEYRPATNGNGPDLDLD